MPSSEHPPPPPHPLRGSALKLRVRLLVFPFGNEMLLTLVQARSVTKLCPTLCNPMDCSPPGFSVHGIFQARILEWVAISYSRRSSQPSDQTRISHVSCISSLYHSATCEAPADPRGMYRYIYEGMCTKAQRERQMEALKPTILPTLLSVSRGLCRLAP